MRLLANAGGMQRRAIRQWRAASDRTARSAAGIAAAVVLTAAMPVQAADGCPVLLCLAAPSWRAIPECVPPIQQLFRDLARSRAFPTCAMAGAGNSASHAWASAPGRCPPQYSGVYDGPDGPRHSCDYSGAIAISVDGAGFATTWWSTSGNTVTAFSAAAKALLGTWDTRFDDDYTAWLISQPAPRN